MNLNIGPLKERKHKIVVHKKINRLNPFFLVLFFVLPVVLYVPFLVKWVPSGPIVTSDVFSAVAKVSTPVKSFERTGSAFLVTDKYLITAAHVVSGIPVGNTVKIDFERAKGMSPMAAKVAFSPKNNPNINDYAVLELLQRVTDITPLKIGKSSDCQIGDRILVIGYPGGGPFSATYGSISNESVSPNRMQIDAGAWPGNSGGPIILDGTKEVVGVLTNYGQYDIVQGVKIDALLNDAEFKASGIKFLNHD